MVVGAVQVVYVKPISAFLCGDLDYTIFGWGTSKHDWSLKCLINK